MSILTDQNNSNSSLKVAQLSSVSCRLPIIQKAEVINLSDPKANDATSGPFYLAKLTAYYFAYAFTCVIDLLSSVVLFIPKLVSEIYNADLIESIKEARSIAIKSSMTITLPGKIRGTIVNKTFSDWKQQEIEEICCDQYKSEQPLKKKDYLEICDFLIAVKLVKQKVKLAEDPDEIRQAIDTAMSTKAYQALKSKDNNPAVEFLQILAVKEMSADCRDAIRNYGAKVIGPLNKEEYSWGELADIMDKPASDILAFKRNGFASNAIWAAAHPWKVLHAQESSLFPTEFNSHEGNPNILGYSFENPKDSSTKMQFYYGPGPTGDRLYNDGVLIYMDKLNNKGFHIHELRENFQNINQTSEALRVFEIMRYEQKHPQSMRLISLSFDTEIMNMSENRFCKFAVASDFINIFKKYALGSGSDYRTVLQEYKDDNGIFIGEKAIKDQKFQEAFDCADKIFSNLSIHNDFWNTLIQSEKGKKRLGRMMQLGTHAIISLGAVFTSLEELRNCKSDEAQKYFNKILDHDLTASRVSGACKQDIDRAIVENVALRLFFRLLSNDTPLSKEEVQSIVGGVIGRGRMVEGRLIQWKRYEILSDLLHFVGDQANVKTLSMHLKNYVGLQKDSMEQFS